jgi:NAD(P)-dependent dehydrogenase (short-subunit alcohol dehydrogenase family)
MLSMSKYALITGGGSGIGRAAALRLAEAGWTVAVCGRRQAALDETIALSAGSMVGFAADLTDPVQVAELFDWIDQKFPRLDLLFNNAGMGAPGVPMEELTYEQWNAVVGINLTAPFLCAQQAMKRMKRQLPMGGRIVNNGSISAQTPRPNSAPYTATKHAITGLTKSIALDGRPFRIACGQIDIGNAATNMTERMMEGVPQANGTKMVEPRMDVAHVADALLYMAELPLEANVLTMTVMATTMPLVGRG